MDRRAAALCRTLGEQTCGLLLRDARLRAPHIRWQHQVLLSRSCIEPPRSQACARAFCLNLNAYVHVMPSSAMDPPPVFLNTLPGVHCSNIRADASHMYPPSSKKRPRVWLRWFLRLAEAMSFLRSNYLKRNGTTWSCRRLRQPKKARPARGQPEDVRLHWCAARLITACQAGGLLL